MCLDNVSEKLVADKDVVCYKWLIVVTAVSPSVKDGDSFTGIIGDIECKGKIAIEGERVFFCTNNVALDGAFCNDKKGYTYSWVLDKKVESITVKGKNVIKKSYSTPYFEVPIKIGKTYTSSLIKSDGEVNIGLHSFATINDVGNDTNGEDVIVKCIIPERSEYYRGTFNGAVSYASNCLKYVRIIKDDAVSK